MYRDRDKIKDNRAHYKLSYFQCERQTPFMQVFQGGAFKSWQCSGETSSRQCDMTEFRNS